PVRPATRLANGRLGTPGAGVARPFLTVQLARGVRILAALFGLVRALAPMGLNAAHVQPHHMALRRDAKDRLVERHRASCRRTVLPVNLQFHVSISYVEEAGGKFCLPVPAYFFLYSST